MFNLLFIFWILSMCFSDQVPLPDHDRYKTDESTYGYWFEAQSDFYITSLHVPTDRPDLEQTTQIIKFKEPPLLFPFATESEVLFYDQNNPSQQVCTPSPIPIAKGDIIGIVGGRFDRTQNHLYYDVSSEPFFTSNIFGYDTKLISLMSKDEIVSTPQNYFSSVVKNIRRIEVEVQEDFYDSACFPPVTVTTTTSTIGYSSSIGTTYGSSTGYTSTVGGYSSTSGDYSSTVGGYSSTVGGYSSTSGDYSSTSGDYTSTVGGYSSTSGGYSSTVGGYSSTSGDYSSTVGGYSSTSSSSGVSTSSNPTSTGNVNGGSDSSSSRGINLMPLLALLAICVGCCLCMTLCLVISACILTCLSVCGICSVGSGALGVGGIAANKFSNEPQTDDFNPSGFEDVNL